MGARPNQRCPCGSGRKHKKCCGRVLVPKEPEPARPRKKLDPALAAWMAWLLPPR
jgi:hypothetical protein